MRAVWCDESFIHGSAIGRMQMEQGQGRLSLISATSFLPPSLPPAETPRIIMAAHPASLEDFITGKFTALKLEIPSDDVSAQPTTRGTRARR